MTVNPKTIAITAGLLGVAALIPMIAAADVSLGQTVGVEDAELRAALEAEGYQILEIERERDEIEVETLLNGQAIELELDPVTGAIIAMELDNDDDRHDDAAR